MIGTIDEQKEKLKQIQSENIFEIADIVSKLIQSGLTHSDIMASRTFTQAELNHLLLLTTAPKPLVEKLKPIGIKLAHAAQLVFQYKKWIKSPYASYADLIVDRLINHINAEQISDRGWQFLLEFYWADGKPFMAPELPRS